MGVSAENEDYLYRIDNLRKTNAFVKFLSLEPLLGPIYNLELEGIDWVIVGGESGPRSRPIDESWVIDIQNKCKRANLPFFFKQFGEWIHVDAMPSSLCAEIVARGFKGHKPTDPTSFWRVGKKRAGRELDGRTWEEYPN